MILMIIMTASLCISQNKTKTGQNNKASGTKKDKIIHNH